MELEIAMRFNNRTCLCFRAIALVLFPAWCVFSSTALAVTPTNKVRLYMNIGTVEIELYGTQSPLNVANFLSYVDSGAYNNTIIHRTRDNTNTSNSDLFAQGGSYSYNSLTPIATGAAVKNEFNAANGLSNTKYTLAAALSNGIDTATSGWFINETNNAASFDPGKYTIMGKVTVGMSIIDQIPFFTNLPILAGTQLDSMPVTVVNGVPTEVIINKVSRIPILAGDYNMSGSVTAADYTTWRNNLGSITNAAADGNGDGVVNAADYVIWRKAIGHGSGSGSGLGSGSVPEPASASLLLISGWMFVGRRRRIAR